MTGSGGGPYWRDPFTEEALVGALLAVPDTDVQLQILTRLDPLDISRPAVRAAFLAALDLADNSRTIDPVAVADRMAELGTLAKHGGHSTLYDLIDKANVRLSLDQANELVERAQRLSRIRALEDAVARASSLLRAEDPEACLDALRADLDAVGLIEEKGSDDMTSMAMDLMADLEGGERGIRWPWERMTEAVGNLIEGRSLVVTAFSGGGKSALLRSAALGLAGDGHTVVYFSLEETGKEVLGMMACALGGVNYVKYGTGKVLTTDELDRMVEATNRIHGLPLTINDTKQWTPSRLVAKTKQYVASSKARVVIIDHAHLVNYPGRSRDDRMNEIGNFAERMKALAQEQGFTLIAAYQPRKPETGGDLFRPVEPDEIRETSRIHNIVDNTLSPYRPLVEYDPATGADCSTYINGIGLAPQVVEPPRHGKLPPNTRLAADWTCVKPGKRRVGGYGGRPVMLPFDAVTGRIG